jgi:hypothetical protein
VPLKDQYGVLVPRSRVYVSAGGPSTHKLRETISLGATYEKTGVENWIYCGKGDQEQTSYPQSDFASRHENFDIGFGSDRPALFGVRTTIFPLDFARDLKYIGAALPSFSVIFKISKPAEGLTS